ncbi:hypothetical protein GEO21_20745 [Sphingobacterium faecium]|uniref:hypothetical protein n=1 Tax=Sphingobacterium faecium TaxID=34087 RepID=UPI001290BBE0|nr:hypothetical protein [Sphingobacterium faecium]MQP29920.1 hypothetical protein [Sphingobacterium faecium]
MWVSYGQKAAAGIQDENIALVVREYLDDFTVMVEGNNWEKWPNSSFEMQFNNVINNGKNKVHLNLDGISKSWSAVIEVARGLGISRVTNWQLYQVYSNPSILQRTIFYRAGKVVPNPFN